MANTFVLLIKNVDLQDAGSYKCGNDFMAILVGKWTRTNKHFIRLHHDVQKWVLNWLYPTSILFLFWHEFRNPTPNPNLTLILCVTQTTPLTPSHFPTPLLNLKWHVTFSRKQKKFFKLHLNPTGLTASLWFLNFRLNIRDVLRNRWRNDIYHRWVISDDHTSLTHLKYPWIGLPHRHGQKGQKFVRAGFNCIKIQ